MSRKICLAAALCLTLLSLGVGVARRLVMGEEVHRLRGPGAWEVLLQVRGATPGEPHLFLDLPPETQRQHRVAEHCASEELLGEVGPAKASFRIREPAHRGEVNASCTFQVVVGTRRPSFWSPRADPADYDPPRQGESLQASPLVEVNDPRISDLARYLTADLGRTANTLDLSQALYRYVTQAVPNFAGSVAPAPTRGPSRAEAVSALQCLEQNTGDDAAKSRLLLALLRNRNIPARLVTGLALTKGPVQSAHHWVEAWVHGRWLPMCSYHGHFGQVPDTYLLFAFHDQPLVRGRNLTGLRWAYHVRQLRALDPAAEDSPWRAFFAAVSLHSLPPAERHLVEILLLLPLATLIICVCRNLIGLTSFGTFAPALIGLAFHELHSLPGIAVFVAVLLVGWGLRRVLDGFRLLQVPRVALLLTLITVLLVGLVAASHRYGASTTQYISLFPVVILTGLVERFWTVETEDSTAASFKTLFQTMLIALLIAVVLGLPLVGRYLFCYPEILGLMMAAQILLGRYTGFRLVELFRFRALLRPSAPGGQPS